MEESKRGGVVSFNFVELFKEKEGRISRLPIPNDFVRVNKRPYTTLTYAQSIDGSIAGEPGKQLTLSCNETMRLTHQLRACHAGILVGVNTIIVDDPSLTVRFGVEGNPPLPIIMDSKLRCPLHCKLLTSKDCVRPIIVTTQPKEAEHESRAKNLQDAGAKLIFAKSSPTGRIDLDDMLAQLSHLVDSLMVEGGAAVIQSFLASSSPLVDEILITISPILVGGVKSIAQLLPQPSSKFKLQNVRYSIVGSDFVMQARLNQ